ncbi:MAG TPA: GNAT family N-acetyltransferase [Coxiellaceae bacterium]|nr:GNAT family N-acetyltransferase [Coxiellaceae bacterium]
MIRCRFAKPSDLKFIYQALKNMAQEQGVIGRFCKTPDFFEKALFSETPLAQVLLAEQDNEVVGLCMFSETNRNFTLFEKPGIFIHDIYVVPTARRQNVATTLFKEIQKIAKERDYGRIDWVVLKMNTGAKNFYKTWVKEGAGEVDYIHYMRMPVTLDKNGMA